MRVESQSDREERARRVAPPIHRCLAAEVFGTFVLTLVAAGADVVDTVAPGGIGHVARYLAPGLVLIALIFSLSGVSGAHLNPAVTIAFIARGVFAPRRAIGYWLSQFAGATAAGFALVAIFPYSARFGISSMHLEQPQIVGVATEAVLTMILVFVILGTSEQKAIVGKNAALAVGFTVAACGLFSSPISGASMNPARSLGPAIASLTFTNWWIYLAGPIAGALAAAGLARLIYGPRSEDECEAAAGGAATH